MAGIGFEIKKIYEKRSIINKLQGLTYTSFVSIGPTVICILMLLVIREITQQYGISYLERETLNSAILYAFVFSLIFVSGPSMVMSRYISDKIYSNEMASVFPSLIGILMISLMFSGSIGIGFYALSPLPILFKLLSYMMYIELTIIFMFMVYISAIKDYKRVSIAFLMGMILTSISSLVLIHFVHVGVVTSILIGINVGFLLNILIVLKAIDAYFKIRNQKYFEFLTYFTDFPKLFWINAFYTLGLFVHNLMFWFFSKYDMMVSGTYLSAPMYDLASFYAVLTIMPATVMFVLKIETSFYVKYKSFLLAIVNGGSLHDLKKSKGNMNFMIKEEISFIMEIQLLVSLMAVVVLSQLAFPYFSVSAVVGELLGYLALGYYASFMAFLITTILLYFNIQNYALMIQGFFLMSNGLLSLISIFLGENFYGLGMAISGTLTLILALILFKKSVDDIDYRIFAQQPLVNTKKVSWMDKFISKVYKESL